MLRGEPVIDSNVTEIFPYFLAGVAVGVCGAAAELRSILNRPKGEIRSDTRGKTNFSTVQNAWPRMVVGDNGHTAQREPLPESFVVAEDKGPVFQDGSAGRAT